MKKMKSLHMTKGLRGRALELPARIADLFRKWGTINSLLLAAAIVVATAGLSYAQSSQSTGVTLNASVIQGMTLTVSNSSLNLGSLVAGTTPAALSAATSPIQFTLTANGTSPVTVTFASVTMSGPSKSSLNFTPAVTGDASSANQATAATVTSGQTITLGGTNFSATNYYFWLGGNVGTLPANQTPGNYTGTFTLTVTY